MVLTIELRTVHLTRMLILLQDQESVSKSLTSSGTLRHKHACQPASFWVKKGTCTIEEERTVWLHHFSKRLNSNLNFLFIWNLFLQIFPSFFFNPLSLPTLASLSRSSPVNWINLSVPEFLALKHDSRIFGQTSSPCGFSMMEHVRLCAEWPIENWLGSSLNLIRGSTTV